MGWRQINIGKAPGGCKGDWTTAELLPRRGEGAMGCAQVNRKTAQENAEEVTNYDANKAGDGVSPIGRTAGAPGGRGRVRRDRGTLNQYTAVGSFEPEFDADGKAADGCKADWTHALRAPRRGEGAMGRARINQTKVQTSTGIWNVTYNAENRPVTFNRTNSDGTTTRVTCAYDYMGRRATKKVETISAADAETGESTATTILHQRYIYRGYLQIAGSDLTEFGHSFSWFITWDPIMIKKTFIIITVISTLICLSQRIDVLTTTRDIFNKKETNAIYSPEQAFDILRNENDWCGSVYYCFTIGNKYFFTRKQKVSWLKYGYLFNPQSAAYEYVDSGEKIPPGEYRVVRFERNGYQKTYTSSSKNVTIKFP